MSGSSRTKRGLFQSKKTTARIKNSLKAMSEAKKKRIEEALLTDNHVCKGLRIVQIGELGKNLKCRQCGGLLDLSKVMKEKLTGCHSVLTILCDACKIATKVNTAKVVGDNVSEVNAGLILGAIHSGAGQTALNKILACADIPPISNDLYKQYEKLIGKAVEDEAKDSCKRAALEERELVIKNIQKLIKQLPQHVARDIYPHLKILESSKSNKSKNIDFDSALGEIINIIVSFDTGWTKRGNGRSYDSLNGYSAIIGFLSGKILDYTTRNRKCRMCELGHDKSDHDCRLNHNNSAKSMEADAGVQLINHSSILKEAKLQVRVIIGDEDSSMIAAVRKDNPTISFHKLADKNHLVKNFGTELYTIADAHKQLYKKGVIGHIKKCFAYGVSQNKGNCDRLAKHLRCMPGHLYGNHENCGFWCKYKEKHTVHLTDEKLYEKLVQFYNKYALNAAKFSVSASSQANESFNNVIAHKAHKNQCLSRSCACDIRVGDGVCVWNDGEKCTVKFRMRLGLNNGHYTIRYAETADGKRVKRKIKSSSVEAKLRRMILKQQKEAMRKSYEQSEGITYQRNCGMNIEIEMPLKTISDGKLLTVLFDLETTGLDANAEIVQIAAKCKNFEFDIYINPTREISRTATKVTGLSNCGGMLCLNGKAIDSVSLQEGLTSFQQFLNSLSKTKKCLLVAHNATFDTRVLLRQLSSLNMLKDFNVIAGFADSLKIFKSVKKDRKGAGKFTLNALASEFLTKADTENLHDAMADVRVLQKLVDKFECHKKLLSSKKLYYDCCEQFVENNKVNLNLQFLKELKNVISLTYLKKLAKYNITYKNLLDLFQNKGEKGILEMFTEVIDKKVKITKNESIINSVVKFLKEKTK